MANSKDHHFIPQMHLRLFAANAAGQVLTYDKRWGSSPTYKFPKGQCKELNLYSFSSEEEPDGMNSGIEDIFLSRIDSDAAAVLAGMEPNTARNHKELLACYLSSLIVRHPRTINILQTHGNAIFEEYYSIAYNDPEFRTNLRKFCQNEEEYLAALATAPPGTAVVTMNRDFVMASCIEVFERLARILMAGDWTLLLSPPQERFILSDNPVFTCRPSLKEKGLAAIGSSGCETIVPISPQYCLLIKYGKSRFKVRGASESVAREINRRSAYNSEFRFFSSERRTVLDKLVQEFSPRDTENLTQKIGDHVVTRNEVDHSLFVPI